MGQTTINVREIQANQTITLEKDKVNSVMFYNDISGEIELSTTSSPDLNFTVYKTKQGENYTTYKYEQRSVAAFKDTQEKTTITVTVGGTEQEPTYTVQVGEGIAHAATTEELALINDGSLLAGTNYMVTSQNWVYDVENTEWTENGDAVVEYCQIDPEITAVSYSTRTQLGTYSYAEQSYTLESPTDASAADEAAALANVGTFYRCVGTKGETVTPGDWQVDDFDAYPKDNNDFVLDLDTNNQKQVLATVTVKDGANQGWIGSYMPTYLGPHITSDNNNFGDGAFWEYDEETYIPAKGAKNTYKGYSLNDAITSTDAADKFELGLGNNTVTFDLTGDPFGNDAVVLTPKENLTLNFDTHSYSGSDIDYQITPTLSGKDVVLTATKTVTEYYTYTHEVVEYTTAEEVTKLEHIVTSEGNQVITGTKTEYQAIAGEGEHSEEYKIQFKVTEYDAEGAVVGTPAWEDLLDENEHEIYQSSADLGDEYATAYASTTKLYVGEVDEENLVNTAEGTESFTAGTTAVFIDATSTKTATDTEFGNTVYAVSEGDSAADVYYAYTKTATWVPAEGETAAHWNWTSAVAGDPLDADEIAGYVIGLTENTQTTVTTYVAANGEYGDSETTPDDETKAVGSFYYKNVLIDGNVVDQQTMSAAVTEETYVADYTNETVLLGTVKLAGYNAANVTGTDINLTGIADMPDTVVGLIEEYNLDQITGKGKNETTFTGTWRNEYALSTEKNETFNMGTGEDRIWFDTNYAGKNAVYVADGETLDLRFADPDGLKYTASGNDLVISDNYLEYYGIATVSSDYVYDGNIFVEGSDTELEHLSIIDNLETGIWKKGNKTVNLQQYRELEDTTGYEFVKGTIRMTLQTNVAHSNETRYNQYVWATDTLYEMPEGYEFPDDKKFNEDPRVSIIFNNEEAVAATTAQGTEYQPGMTLSNFKVYKVENGKTTDITKTYVDTLKATDVTEAGALTNDTAAYNAELAGSQDLYGATVTVKDFSTAIEKATLQINGDVVYAANTGYSDAFAGIKDLFTTTSAEIAPSGVVTKKGNTNDHIEADDFVSADGEKGVTLKLAGGHDVVTGSLFNDTIKGGAGFKEITEEAGVNKITLAKGGSHVELAETSSNTLKAKGGDNRIEVSTIGTNNLTTGAGADTFIVDGAAFAGVNTIKAGAGANTLTVNTTSNNKYTGGKGVDTITLLAGVNNINTGAGADVVTISGGYNVVKTAAGNDTVKFDNQTVGIPGGAIIASVKDTKGNDTYDFSKYTFANGDSITINDAKGANTVVLTDAGEAGLSDDYDVYFNVSIKTKKGKITKTSVGKTFTFSDDNGSVKFNGALTTVQAKIGNNLTDVNFKANVNELAGTVAGWLNANGYKSADAVMAAGGTAAGELLKIYNGQGGVKMADGVTDYTDYQSVDVFKTV